MTTTAVRNRNTTSAEKQVQRGAAWLDRVDPGWWEVGRLNLSQLDLGDGCRCVLGQVVGQAGFAPNRDRPLFYGDAVTNPEGVGIGYGWRRTIETIKARLPRGTKRYAMTHEQAIARGFHVTEGDDWDELTSTWRRLIQARRREANATKQAGR